MKKGFKKILVMMTLLTTKVYFVNSFGLLCIPASAYPPLSYHQMTENYPLERENHMKRKQFPFGDS